MTSRKVLLYDYPLSICCQMTRLTLAEKGVAYERQTVDISVTANEQFEPWYTALNPKAVVPTLAVGDEIITDTLNITPYIDREFEGPALTPSSPEEADAMRVWMRDIMAPHYGVLLYSKNLDSSRRSPTVLARLEKLLELERLRPEAATLLKKRIEGNRRFQALLLDETQVEAEIERVHALVLSFEAPLGKHTFLAGSTYSIGDAFCTAALARFDMHGFGHWWSEGASPNVAAYYERMRARASWEAAGVRAQ